ncbi:MAG: MFS transporter [Chloroflexi bacterium]|nr:MFS transporter [Chloroflexota bacterium]
MSEAQRPFRFLEPKLYYFFYYAALAALTPYLSVYYRSLGFSGRAIGTLSAVTTFVGLVSGPVWSAIADRYNKHRLVLGGAILATTVAGFAISLVHEFAPMVFIVAVYAFVHAPVTALADSSVMVVLGDRKDLFSRQRLWGAVGWGLAAPVIGQLTEQMGLQWGFYAYVVLNLFTLATALNLPSSRPATKAPFWHGIRDLFRQRAWIVFLGALFISGLGSHSSSGFLFLHLQDHGGDRSLMGLALAVGSFSEIIVFFLASRWLARWGARRMLIVAMAVSSLRLLLVSLIQTASWILPIQLLHGPSFSLILSAGVTYADSLALPGFRTTAQSGYGFAGALAGVLGNLLGGFVYDAAGSAAVFRMGSAGVLLGLLFLALAGRQSAPAESAI